MQCTLYDLDFMMNRTKKKRNTIHLPRSDANLFWWMNRKILIYPLHAARFVSFIYINIYIVFFCVFLSVSFSLYLHFIWWYLTRSLWRIVICDRSVLYRDAEISAQNPHFAIHKTKSSASIYAFFGFFL